MLLWLEFTISPLLVVTFIGLTFNEKSMDSIFHVCAKGVLISFVGFVKDSVTCNILLKKTSIL
jgi:hypothetical protein